MSDERRPDEDDADEDSHQEAEPQQDDDNVDLSDLVDSGRWTSAWADSINDILKPLRHQLSLMESTRRAIDSVMGAGNPLYRAGVDAQLQALFAGPVQALQSPLSDLYDWRRSVDDFVRSVSLPRTLLDQLAATAALF